MPEPTTGPTPTGHGNGVNKCEIPPHDKYELQVGGGDVGDFGDTDGPLEIPPDQIEALRQRVQKGSSDRKSLESVAWGLPASLLDELLHLADQVAGETLAVEEPPKRGRGRPRKKATYPAGLSGAAMAPYLADHFRLVDTEDGDVIWRYHQDEGRWTPLTTHSNALRRYIYSNSKQWRQELDADGQQELAESWSWDTPPPERSEFWTALGQGIKGYEPEPESFWLNTPTGTVNLREGVLHPHSPGRECRAITTGAFQSDRIKEHEQLLRARLDLVLSPESQETWLDMVALALTGDGQMFRAILYVYGEDVRSSGAGKTSLNNLVTLAMGSYGYTVSPSFFASTGAREIDAVRADILKSRARWVSCDELAAGNLQIAGPKTMSMTGDTTDTARGPFGAPIKGFYYFMLGVSSIGAPQMERYSGMERRICAVPVLAKKIPVRLRKRPSQYHLDALITVCALRAAKKYEDGYQEPVGDEATLEAILRDMDALGTWLAEYREEIDEAGISNKELLQLVQEDVDPKLTPTKLGIAVRMSGLYIQDRDSQGKRRVCPGKAENNL